MSKVIATGDFRYYDGIKTITVIVEKNENKISCIVNDGKDKVLNSFVKMKLDRMIETREGMPSTACFPDLPKTYLLVYYETLRYLFNNPLGKGLISIYVDGELEEFPEDMSIPNMIY